MRGLLPQAEDALAGEVDPEALAAIGIDFEGVRRAVERTFGEGALASAPDRRARSARVRKPPFTPETKRALALALRVAIELRDHRIRPGHVLLGLLRLDDDFISSIVQQSGATIAGLSAAGLEHLDAP